MIECSSRVKAGLFSCSFWCVGAYSVSSDDEAEIRERELNR